MQRRVAGCTMWRPYSEDYPAFSQRRTKRIDKGEEAGMCGEKERRREREREGWKREKREGGGGKRGKEKRPIAAKRLLNLHRLCVVNEPDMFYAFARARGNYETRNKCRQKEQARRNVQSFIPITRKLPIIWQFRLKSKKKSAIFYFRFADKEHD